ncbi:MAG TPA: MerR family transcriptional regulator [Desulfobacterales bacterium]
METNPGYPIRYAARASGVKPHVIRTWERRYQAVEPHRTDTNRRLYSEGDIRRLRLLKAAVDAGHSISQVSALETEALSELVDRALPLEEPAEPVGRDVPDEVANVLDEALEAVTELDARRLERVLEQAAVKFTRPVLLQDVILPLFYRIGEQWAAGRVKIIGEHMATIVARTLLWDMLRTVEIAETAPRVVLATPAGQWHELGVLVAALVAADAGWQPVYFGPNLPAEEIAAAVSHTGARALALGITHRLDDNRLATELKKVRRFVGSRLPIFVGGRVTEALGATLAAVGAKPIAGLDAFRTELDRITAARDGRLPDEA